MWMNRIGTWKPVWRCRFRLIWWLVFCNIASWLSNTASSVPHSTLSCSEWLWSSSVRRRWNNSCSRSTCELTKQGNQKRSSVTFQKSFFAYLVHDHWMIRSADRFTTLTSAHLSRSIFNRLCLCMNSFFPFFHSPPPQHVRAHHRPCHHGVNRALARPCTAQLIFSWW